MGWFDGWLAGWVGTLFCITRLIYSVMRESVTRAVWPKRERGEREDSFADTSPDPMSSLCGARNRIPQTPCLLGTSVWKQFI